MSSRPYVARSHDVKGNRGETTCRVNGRVYFSQADRAFFENLLARRKALGA